MAHKVYFNMPERELGKVDIVITIYKDDRRRRSSPRADRIKQKLGDFRLSKGGVDWYRKGVKTKVRSLSWSQLARLIDET